MAQKRVLVVDDEKLIRWSLSRMLEKSGYMVEIAGSGEEAREKVESFNPHMILLDIWLPDALGTDLLNEFKQKNEELIILMITANAQSDYVVQAFKYGAEDYIGKPFKLEMVEHTIAKAFEKKSLIQEPDGFGQGLDERFELNQMVGNSPKMIEVFRNIRLCAESDCKTVLILGESGTGKELVAQAINQHSARAEEPFIELNCAAIPENLLENELFGHQKGAYTDASSEEKGIFENANKGTVFLDEIGDLPLSMQGKLLKVIESKRFRRLGGKDELETDVRIIAATNRNLAQMVEDGLFRGDLFFRLNVMVMRLPALRERKEDIPNLVQYFVAILNKEYGRKIETVSAKGMECLMDYDWPGNVRELRNTIERAIMLENGRVLNPRCPGDEDSRHSDHEVHIPSLQPDGAVSTPQPAENDGRRYANLPASGMSMDEMEKELIVQALVQYSGNQTEAAKHLGISRDTIRYRIKKYKLSGFGKDTNNGKKVLA